TAIGRANEQTTAVAGCVLDPGDQFMDPLWLEELMIITHIAFVVDLDKHVAVAALEEPGGGGVRGSNHRSFIGQALVLSEVEVPKDHHHAGRVGSIEDPFESSEISRSQRTIRFERGVMPRLLPGVT